VCTSFIYRDKRKLSVSLFYAFFIFMMSISSKHVVKLLVISNVLSDSKLS
jgi:hypothetical protein